jgi:hypothetical protein
MLGPFIELDQLHKKMVRKKAKKKKKKKKKPVGIHPVS